MPHREPSSRVEDYLPLSARDYQILLSLIEGDAHGYAMVQEIDRRTDGRVRFEPANLYRSIRRLIREGLVAPSEERPAPESDDERRRYYRITELGAQVLRAEAARMRELVDDAVAREILSQPE
jgi:DNA-binding PadR family transcriptional regulator